MGKLKFIIRKNVTNENRTLSARVDGDLFYYVKKISKDLKIKKSDVVRQMLTFAYDNK